MAVDLQVGRCLLPDRLLSNFYLSGAGWGGCTISLVAENKVDDFIQKLKETYPPYKNLEGDALDKVIFATKPGSGACGKFFFSSLRVLWPMGSFFSLPCQCSSSRHKIKCDNAQLYNNGREFNVQLPPAILPIPFSIRYVS